MGLFEETIRKQFGFPSKRESLDRKIDDYRLKEAMALDEDMASRQINISYLEEQIRQIERVINDNQLFIDAYETIKRLAIEKIKMGSSSIKSRIVDETGKIIVDANYTTLENYLVAVQKSGNTALLKTYVEQMGAALEKMWQAYFIKIIQGKGFFLGEDSEFADGLDIYSEYNKVVLQMKRGALRNEQRESKILAGNSITLINGVYAYSKQANSTLYLALQKLQNALRDVQNEQASDEYTKKTITEMQTMLKSTSEYFEAKRSEEILSEISNLGK